MPAFDAVVFPLTTKEIERFLAKVNKDTPNGCWMWTASLGGTGYGQLTIRRNTKSINCTSHRLSWMIHKGCIPDGLCVLHNCPGGDTPGCVNPLHLFLGTKAENQHDMKAKGRARTGKGDESGRRKHPDSYVNVVFKGEENPSAKLTEEDVKKILRMAATGRWSSYQIARMVGGVCSVSIQNIIKRKTWKHVTIDD